VDRILAKKWKLSDLLKLVELKGFSSRLTRKAIETYDSPEHLFNSNDREFSKILQETLFEDNHKATDQDIQDQFDACKLNEISIITIWDDDYPLLLREIDYPPLILYVKGKLQPNDSNAIGVVGTRKNTHYGRLATEHFTNSFARHGLIVVSGLAYGTDTLAHLNTIKANGITYAIIASGIDKIMPAEAKKVADKIIESGGAIISEYKCGMKSLPVFFAQRNRIISGISQAALIIESGIKGGSLITANFAFDQGREVFAVPGNIFSEKCEGTNMLIHKNIASPALSADTMLQALGYQINPDLIANSGSRAESLSYEENLIIEKLTYEPIHIDKLMELTSFEMPVLLVKLLEMEFKGLIRQLPGKYYIKSIN
jgi:DNA processing protein